MTSRDGFPYPSARYEYREPIAGLDGWLVGVLSQNGLDVAQVSAAVERVRSGECLKVDSLLIARHGELLMEACFPEDHGDHGRVARDDGTHLMASVR